MDVAGAPALAERIAEGKPPDEGLQGSEVRELSGREAAPLSTEVPRSAQLDVVYFHPRTLAHERQVWIYVRCPDGRLRRAD
jgi:hypothetical protein